MSPSQWMELMWFCVGGLTALSVIIYLILSNRYRLDWAARGGLAMVPSFMPVAAIFLIVYGTGPVRGFAVTLVIGLFASMFTAVFVSRQLFELILLRIRRDQTLSI